ncbi:hypothetical protein P692DRAFT_201727585 [Suillus brevipes Sb2]|nr:hypothetical protein P692DRAFT_201727585 [Suillus brevipes Sb2]
MNTINASTGFSPFQLHISHSPRILPPLIPATASPENVEEDRTQTLLSQLNNHVMEAQDNLLAAKAAQATNINKHHVPALTLNVGNRVMLATKHRQREYM